MDLQLLFQNDIKTTSLSISDEHSFLILKFTGVIDHESYKTACEKLYNAITVYRYKKIVYDLKELTYTDMQSRAWFATSFLPKVIKSFGLDFRTALVKSDDQYERLSVDFLTKVGSNLGFKNSINCFNTVEEAYTWLYENQSMAFSG